MKIIESKLFIVQIHHNFEDIHKYIEASSINEALEIVNLYIKPADEITKIEKIHNNLIKKSTKTVTVDI